MPIYSYKCHKCQYVFDVLCKYVDTAQECPECGTTTPDRQLSAPHGRVARSPYEEFT